MALYSDFVDDLRSGNDVDLVTDIEAINQQIYNVLGVPPYQVPGRPDFASTLHRYLHEPDDIVTRSAVETEIFNVLKNFVTRIDVTEVQCQSIENGMIIVFISYIYKQDRVEKQFEVNLNG